MKEDKSFASFADISASVSYLDQSCSVKYPRSTATMWH